jgi:hypothetical protein
MSSKTQKYSALFAIKIKHFLQGLFPPFSLPLYFSFQFFILFYFFFGFPFAPDFLCFSEIKAKQGRNKSSFQFKAKEILLLFSMALL